MDMDRGRDTDTEKNIDTDTDTDKDMDIDIDFNVKYRLSVKIKSFIRHNDGLHPFQSDIVHNGYAPPTHASWNCSLLQETATKQRK
jgi:hypothetical protein